MITEIIDGVVQGGGGSTDIAYQSYREELNTDYSVKYRAWNTALNASNDATDWIIEKNLYSNGVRINNQILTGSWTLKDSLPWTI